MFSKLRKLMGFRESESHVSQSSCNDVIYPVHVFDCALRGTSVVQLMRFNDVLDAKKLHLALTKLLEIGDWRKLGGRLRLDRHGKLQLHVPQVFTPQRPAVAYHSATFDVKIEEHPLGRDLPELTDQPSLQHNIHRLSSFWAGMKLPNKFADYLSHDTPSLALQIVTFQNATLVGLHFPHILTDIMGTQMLFRAWSQVLAGRESDVLPLSGAWEDASKPIWEAQNEEPFFLMPKLLTGWKLVKFVLCMGFRILQHPRVDSRTLFLPAQFLDLLRRRASEDLKECTFMSDGDILCAWLTRLIGAANKWTQGISLMGIIDIRSRVPSVFKDSGAYLQNLSIFSYTAFSQNVLAGPLGLSATQVRRSLLEQTTEAQIRAGYQTLVQRSLKSHLIPIFAQPGSLVVFISNWSKAKFSLTVDFKPALVQIGEQGNQRQNAAGTMLYLIGGPYEKSAASQNSAFIMGKDHSGNYWITLVMAEEMFEVVQKLLCDENLNYV